MLHSNQNRNPKNIHQFEDSLSDNISYFKSKYFHIFILLVLIPLFVYTMSVIYLIPET